MLADMDLKKIISFAAAVNMALVCLTSCGQQIGEKQDLYIPDDSEAETPEPDVSEPVGEEKPTEAIADRKVTANEIKYVKYSKTYQAESGTLGGGAKVAKTRKGYTGKGYVTGINTENDSWELTFDITDTQYYDITLTVASDSAVKNSLAVNERSIGDFSTTGSGKFETVTFENVYIEKGYAKISMLPASGEADIDSVKLEASADISKLKLGLEKASLVNKNAGYATKALYKYICEGFGKQILLGQHDSVGTVTETSKIFDITGRYPAIRFGDMMPFTDDMIIGENEIEYAKQWAQQGGIVGYMWHWTDPLGSGEYYSDKTDFDISKAVTKEKIATLSLDEIKKLNEDGKVSDECVAIVEDIDKISEKLKELQSAGIPVLWRPLQEASNGYFWWGKDAESYKWLWKLLYQRQTSYHKLNNLIWVWSAQNSSWYVGDDLCDILSLDIYDRGNLSGQVNRLLFLYKICKTKPIVMGECGNLPSIQNIADEKAMWAYIGQWGGNFLLDESGELNEEYNTAENLIDMYSNDLTISRDELPDLSELAQKLKEEEKAAAEAEKETEESSANEDESSAEEKEEQ